MGNLTQTEKGLFLKLFNRDGYVLNFSTSDFDIFTVQSIDIPLCETYGLSKGKSLKSYINEGSPDKVIKLLNDLLDYYEDNYEYEIECNNEYSKLYSKCKQIIKYNYSNHSPLSPVAENLKQQFSSEYLSTQIDLMLKMQSENPTEAIGKSKELIESCCKTILDKNEIKWDKNWDVGQLIGKTLTLLKLMPRDIPDTSPASDEIKAILGNLRAIATKLAELRNPYGSGHGKSATYKGLEERHAKLAVGSSITLVSFIWDTYEMRVDLK